MNGVACNDAGSVSTNKTNSTRRMLIVENATSEYFVVMPDLFLRDGSLDAAKTTIESDSFKTALSSSSVLSDVKLSGSI